MSTIIQDAIAQRFAQQIALQVAEQLAKLGLGASNGVTVNSGQRQPCGLLSAIQAAERLGLSPRTLEAMRRKGDGVPYRKVGRRVLYDPIEVDAYVSSRSFASTSEARRAGIL